MKSGAEAWEERSLAPHQQHHAPALRLRLAHSPPAATMVGSLAFEISPRSCGGRSEGLRFLQSAGVDLSAGGRNAPTVTSTIGAFFFALQPNLDASTSIFSIFGDWEKSSGAFAVSAFATSPAR